MQKALALPFWQLITGATQHAALQIEAPHLTAAAMAKISSLSANNCPPVSV